MRIYETATIFRPDLPEEQVNELISRVEGEVEKGGGKVTEINQWGLRKLAYKIDRHSNGNYVFFKYAAPSMLVRDVEYLLRVTEGVIRFLTIKMEDEVDERELASIQKVHKKEEVASVEEEESVAQQKDASGKTAEEAEKAPDMPVGQEPVKEEADGGEEADAESGGSEEKPGDAGPEEKAESGAKEDSE